MLRRPLPRLAGAQALGIWLADAGWLAVDAALVLAALASAGGALAAGRRRALEAAALVLALASGALALGARLDAAARHRPQAPLERRLEGTVAASARGRSWTRVELADARGAAPGSAPVPERVQVYAGPGAFALGALHPGARLRLQARLRAPRSRRNPGARDRLRPLERRGVGAVASLSHPRLQVRIPQRDSTNPLAALHRARVRLAAALIDAGPGGGLLAALALGERRGLGDGHRDAFRRLGLSHLLAVSGLHLLLVAGLAFGTLRAALARSAALAARRDVRVPALAAALAAAALYALLAGWGIPVRRALVLLVALLVAVARARPGSRADPLAAAALWVLARDPAALFDPGAQLSFVASAALAAAAARAEDARPAPAGGAVARAHAAVAEALRTSAGAVAVTAPLAAWHFGQAAPLALVANVVAVPWTALVLLPAALVAAAAAAAPATCGAAAALALAERIAQLSLRAVAVAATALPGSAAGAPPAARWLVCAGALALLALRARSTPRRAALAVAVGGLLALAPPARVAPAPPRAVVLDVGQGDATLVQGRRAAVLVDAGAAGPGGADLGRSVVVPALAALGVRRLDAVVATHADADHCGGIPAVLAALPVAVVWIPLGARGDAGFDALRAAAAARGVPVVERGAGSAPLRAGDLAVVPLWPPAAGAGRSRNDRSLVVRVAVAGRRLLLPGDVSGRAEAELLASGADVRADVMLLPHHGSRSSATARFLRAVGASLAVASAPLAGRFGMPHPEVLERARAARLSTWWTGRDGAVRVSLARPLAVWGSADSGR